MPSIETVPVDEPADELGIVDRRGADDDARRAGLREGLGRVEIADAAAGLDLHGKAVRDRAEVIEVRGSAGARSIEVDDVKPLRAFGDELARGLERRRGDLLDGREIAACHADGAAFIDIDGGVDDHAG
ncbi:MAG: hypothetical protein AUI15_08030 [Actinobacteria bacterium 13_2_20CM_2_66_6]|nr:MAG: hypothetical protein AUI15_08030 [Actinobacteria bacterium 13_2_20CM_2_66_6]